MRYLFLLVALGWPAQAAHAAPPAAVQLNSLPRGAMILANSWRYHTGDNPAWARPDFDDNAWDTPNPT